LLLAKLSAYPALFPEFPVAGQAGKFIFIDCSVFSDINFFRLIVPINKAKQIIKPLRMALPAHGGMFGLLFSTSTCCNFNIYGSEKYSTSLRV